MHSHKYENDICTFLLRQENDNVMAMVTGIAFREIIEKALPVEILRRLSAKEIDDEREWLEAVQYHGMQEEAFQRRGGRKSSESSLGKRERPKEKDRSNKKPKKDKPWKTKEKRSSGTKGSKGSKPKKRGGGAPKLHTDWKQAHDGISQEVVDKRRADNGCTRCGLNNHEWKDCRKNIAISTVTIKGAANKGKKDWKRNPNHQPKGPRVNKVGKTSRPENVWAPESDSEDALSSS